MSALTIQIKILQYTIALLLCLSHLIGSVFLTLMFIPPFALFGWMFLPIVVASIVAQTDRQFNLPYNPKRIIKINYALLQFLWGFVKYIPLFAEYAYLKFFVLDIFYGSRSNSNRLDVYIPDTAKFPHVIEAAYHPVIVFIHGSAWSSGSSKSLYILLALRLRQMGYIVVVPDYSAYPEVELMISDIKRAMVWTKRYINKFGGDPSKIHIMGHSSGAHLGALVTVRDAIIKSRTSSTYFEDIDPELELPKIAGVYDIARHFHCEAKRGVEEISAMTRVMGDTLENLALNSPTLLLDNAIRDAQINPETLNNLLPPKILLIHGDKDNCVPTESSIRFNHVLNELYIKDLKLRIFPGMGHDEPITSLMFSPFTSKYTLQLLSEMADFMLY
ncbi:19523_t:CDS:2 [Entrophospora sp. SA101]|nr:3827_t:CDS:2 [Entrophospora sp. SA101]CAJ0756995.1 19523_t:CDS:2 [Entrophospora sp. SA101]